MGKAFGHAIERFGTGLHCFRASIFSLCLLAVLMRLLVELMIMVVFVELDWECLCDVILLLYPLACC